MTVAHNKPALLYHFTAEIFLPPILQDGIKPSPHSKDDEMDGVAIDSLGVWLTVNPNPGHQQWITGSLFDKSAVRLTVAVPNECRSSLVEWQKLAAETGVSRQAYRALDKTGGYGAKHWWVYRGQVETCFIKAIDVRGQLIDLTSVDRSQLWQRRREELQRVRRLLGTLPVDVALTPDEAMEFGKPA